MPANILVAVIDGLRASALGAYGNTSFATPALDHFAAQSLLLDWCYAPSAELAEIYRALWHSSHPAGSFPRLFAESNYSTTFITDEPALNTFAAASDFDEIVRATTSQETSVPAEHAVNPSETQIARLFAATLNAIGNLRHDKPCFVWLHARGLYGPWDAPLELQQSLLDEDDPLPVESLVPPDFVVKPDDDPDAVFRYACAYAAQTIVLDACWESFLNALEAADGEQWLVMLIGARGFPLGEHARIGGIDPRLYAEQLHVPWLIRFPDNAGRLARGTALTSHQDVLLTLIDSIDLDRKLNQSTFDGVSVAPFATAARIVSRDAIISTGATARAIRTPAWCLREDFATNDRAPDSNDSTSRPELFVRPDDRWEANDVAKLCSEVVDELRAR